MTLNISHKLKLLLNHLNIKRSLRTKKSVGKKKATIKEDNTKVGCLYLFSTRTNTYSILLDTATKKVVTSCTLRVPQYINEYNERENLNTRGVELGKVFSNKLRAMGYNQVSFFIKGQNKAFKGFMYAFKKAHIKVDSVIKDYNFPHNGCRPANKACKKNRTRRKQAMVTKPIKRRRWFSSKVTSNVLLKKKTMLATSVLCKRKKKPYRFARRFRKLRQTTGR